MRSNDKDVRKLVAAAESEDLIVFVGAGVSRLAGGPSWEEFSKKYLRHLYLNKAINYSTHEYLYKVETRKLISICNGIEKSKPKIPKFNIGKLFNNPQEDEELGFCSDIYTQLYKLSSIFVTTNYDGYIDREVLSRLNLQKAQEKVPNSTSGPIIYHYQDINSTSVLQNGNVIHIHGSVNDPQKRHLVLTTIDYFEAYNNKDKSLLPDFLDAIFNEKTVLFVGYGLEEYEVLEYMLKRKGKITDIRHYMLYPMLKEEREFFHLQESYYAELGIKLIKYDISELGYRQLYFEVKELASKVGPNAHHKEKLAKLKLVDDLL